MSKRSLLGGLIAQSSYTPDQARTAHKPFHFSKDGRIDEARLEGLRSFLIKYGIVKREAAPPVNKLYTPQFTP